MDNFKFIYKILRALEKAMDCPEFDLSDISAERLGITGERWARYMEMMADSGYIKGITVIKSVTGEVVVSGNGVRITLLGLEYLTENGIMQRMYNAAKGVADLIP